MSQRACIEAVHRGDLRALEDLAPSPLVDEVLAAGRAIGDTTRREADRLADRIAAAVGQRPITVPPTPVRHEIVVGAINAPEAEQIADLLTADGYERWEQLEGGARRSFHHHGTQLTVARNLDHTTVVRISWADRPNGSPWRRLLTPTAGDWDAVALPEWAWRAYPLVRLARLAAERTRLRPAHRATLGPFLATPEQLLRPVLDFAGAAPGDRVVDLGCGDGRLPVTAATLGCEAIGIERDPALVERARQRALAAGLGVRCRIELGDARNADLSTTDVVVAFLPSRVLADLLPSILTALPAGATVVAHEQTRLPPDCPPPDESRVLVGPESLTVAHRWHRSPGRGGNPAGQTA